MRVAIIGGKLQGLEAAYLAVKAGWETTLVDKDHQVPAAELCHNFYCLDAASKENLTPILSNCDFIVPALEDRDVFKVLQAVAEDLKIPVAIDMAAYEISSSKIISDRLFQKLSIPAPQPWPMSSFPLIAKPSGSSGSEGVLKIDDQEGYELFKKESGPGIEDWVLQEYIEGPSYSIEILGHGGSYFPLQVTGLEMDHLYDCKRVYAPVELEAQQLKQFSDIAVLIAREIKLNGIMDVEVVLHQGQLKVLEIDARLPSQTPTAVYHSTGVNMLELLADLYLGKLPHRAGPVYEFQQAVIFEHIAVSSDNLTVAGEHVIGSAGPLNYAENFFGTDEALTDYVPGKKNWVATLINKAGTMEAVREKRNRVVEKIMSELKIKHYYDPVPEQGNYFDQEN